MKKLNFNLVFWIALILVLVVLVVLKWEKPHFISLRDEKGCLVAAGYSWNETERECVRGLVYQVRDFKSCVDARYAVWGGVQKRCKTPGGREFIEPIDLADYFARNIRTRGVDNLGAIPIEGFTPTMYLSAFEGLEKKDFDGVEAIGGKWSFEGDNLVFYREGFLDATSADGVLIEKGLAKLFMNLQIRLRLNVMYVSDVEDIFRVLNGEPNWDKDGVILVWDVQTGEYSCAGCNGERCVKQELSKVIVEEEENLRCTFDFVVRGVSEEFIPTPSFYPFDANCRPGEIGEYEVVGIRRVLTECKSLPLDFGNICKSNDECEYDCVVASDDMSRLQCSTGCRAGLIECEGIRGRCGYGDGKINLFEEGKVRWRCR